LSHPKGKEGDMSNPRIIRFGKFAKGEAKSTLHIMERGVGYLLGQTCPGMGT